MEEKILVTKPFLPPVEEYIEEIKEIWANHWLTNMGPKHEAFREALRDYLGADKVELLTNGHMAIELGLQALGLEGEVITTPFTFASTTHAIVRNGLTPVFCDINPTDYTMDVEKIESLITERTSAILPVHVYGHVCNVEAIEDIAKRHGLKVLYDAAHTFGVRYRGKSPAVWGDVACYSFHATKVFHSIEGGAACFRDDGFAKRLYQLKNFGIMDQEHVTGVGSNAKMNEFAAAMGLCNLRHLPQTIEKRKNVVKRYRELLEDCPGIQLPPIQEGVESNYAYFPIVVHEEKFGATRDDVCAALAEKNIFARKYFYPLTSSFECYEGMFDTALTPVAQYVSRNVLTLPLYDSLPLEAVENICAVVRQCRN